MSLRKVAVLLVSWDGREHLASCLASLQQLEDPGCEVEILVLDNGSQDGTASWLAAEFPSVRLQVSPRNIGFAPAVNQLAAATDADALALLNNDTRVDPGWLRHLVARMEASPEDVAAVAGLILDWEGERLDFAGGALTFDGHAFQSRYHHPLASVSLPEPGAELLFPCGGNVLLRRSSFLAVGGMDGEYFAYYEDVDLGWRLWAGGERVVFEPAATVFHRSQATSDRLGLYSRGFLFERNAYWTAYKNFEVGLWEAMMPAVLLTVMHRTQALLVEGNPGGEGLRAGPSMAPPSAPSGMDRVRVALGFPGPGGLRIEDPRTRMHLQVMDTLTRDLDGLAARRRQVQDRRKRGDREIFARFPLHVVPTYPGDTELFASPGFRSWLPADLDFVHARLEDFLAPEGS